MSILHVRDKSPNLKQMWKKVTWLKNRSTWFSVFSNQSVPTGRSWVCIVYVVSVTSIQTTEIVYNSITYDENNDFSANKGLSYSQKYKNFPENSIP